MRSGTKHPSHKKGRTEIKIPLFGGLEFNSAARCLHAALIPGVIRRQYTLARFLVNFRVTKQRLSEFVDDNDDDDEDDDDDDDSTLTTAAPPLFGAGGRGNGAYERKCDGRRCEGVGSNIFSIRRREVCSFEGSFSNSNRKSKVNVW